MCFSVVFADESKSLIKVSRDNNLLKNLRKESNQDDDEIKIMRNDTNNNWDSEIENITSHLSLSSAGEGDEKNYLLKARDIWKDSKAM